ncbi:unnamed protein product [Mytilus coruscus]|uniref:Uncharacterized protein n=1 Tax=Mytilus coruscus TaxID=42192 RepID=A0A6J8BQJ7_MYTCO|nr:unnamed protein product [Mytilus coruscus]
MTFDSAAVVFKEKMEGQFLNPPIAELRPHEETVLDLRIVMAATMPNIEDEVVEPSSNTENTINHNLDDIIPYELGEFDEDDGEDHDFCGESGNDAHSARSNGINPWELLEGCKPAVQEFNKKMLLLQDYYDEFFKGSSAANRGTLSYLQNIFNYRKVKSDISDNFNYAWELICLATESYVCLLAMNSFEIKSTSDRLNSAPERTRTERSTFIL